MKTNNIINKLEELKRDERILFDKDYQKFLIELKKEIEICEKSNENYSGGEIKSYDEYIKLNEIIKKQGKINEVLNYIGKEDKNNFDNLIILLEKNKKYRVKEVLAKLNINNEKLFEDIGRIVSNYNGKVIPFIENNCLCLLFDNGVDVNNTRSLLKDYKPMFFSNNHYSKIILKEV